MAWHDNLTVPLRVLLNDLDDTSYKYSDLTLQKVLVTAARYVLQEVKISNASMYTIDFYVPNIDPSPDQDEVFSNFIVMKAACLVSGQWKAYEKIATQGLRARLGPIQMETDGGGAGQIIGALFNDGFCAAYQTMKNQHNIGNVANIKAISSVFSHTDLYPYYNNERRF